MIEIDYITFALIMIIYLIALWFIFYKTEKIMNYKTEIRILKSEIEIRNIIIKAIIWQK